ncbi:MCE family protein [Acidiferrimicrobium sp. IK]|uniref:MCE family protein n=1 Tax=Acidiferrimicrobium sp. IK TaxID=2871700 RepID=UPI0021CB018F|nr:MCE family protein [Acidiferrimicrobium sp. IK]MCU4184608.1 MCE family protein [Acidiferrimicrobium sp. IK]
MKKFRERNLLAIAAVSAAAAVLGTFVSIDFASLPLVSNNATYHADMATAVGLETGDVVTIAGVRAGKVTGLSLRGGFVDVTFRIGGDYHVGRDSRLDAKVTNPVGVEYLELTPAGPGRLRGAIPLARTSSPDTLIGDLGQFSKETEQTNIPQLVKSLDVLSQAMSATSPDQAKAALQGIAQLSQVLASHQSQVSSLITQGNDLAAELHDHSTQLVNLISQADLVLQVLDDRKQAITNLLATTAQLSAQVSHIVGGDEASLQPMLANLNAVSGFLAADGKHIDQALPLLAAFDRYTANATGSGPFADFVAPALTLPDNLLAECAHLTTTNQLLGCRP